MTLQRKIGLGRTRFVALRYWKLFFIFCASGFDDRDLTNLRMNKKGQLIEW